MPALPHHTARTRHQAVRDGGRWRAMRYVIGSAVLVVLAMIGLIASKETQRRAASIAGGAAATLEPVATLSVGEAVDVAAGVPRTGHTVVMFTADF
jgi:hypothetical protein